MSNHCYHIELTGFQGPLDLLLGLIQDRELEITNISLAEVTDQFLACVEVIKQLSPDDLTDFLNIAARLILIKSRALLPKPPKAAKEEADEEDVGDELARQLQLYKYFKEAAAELKQQHADGGRSFVRLVPPPKIETPPTLKPIPLDKLLAAARRALEITPPEPSVDEVVSRQLVTIGQQMTLIREKLSLGETVTFFSLLRTNFQRMEIIVTFLALLELIKRRIIIVSQVTLFGDILISPNGTSSELTEADWAELRGAVELS